MRRMDLYTVDTALLSDNCTGDKLLHKCLNFFCCQRTRLFTDNFASDIGSGNRLLAADQTAGRLVSGMMQLDEQFCVISMNGFHQTGELPDYMCIGHAQLVRCTDTGFIIDSGDFRNDQTGTTAGTIRVIFDHAGTGFSGWFRERTSHSGHNDSVFQFKITDFSGRKQFFIIHHSSPKIIIITL